MTSCHILKNTVSFLSFCSSYNDNPKPDVKQLSKKKDKKHRSDNCKWKIGDLIMQSRWESRVLIAGWRTLDIHCVAVKKIYIKCSTIVKSGSKMSHKCIIWQKNKNWCTSAAGLPYYRFALHTVTTVSCICTRWIQLCQLNALLPCYHTTPACVHGWNLIFAGKGFKLPNPCTGIDSCSDW